MINQVEKKNPKRRFKEFLRKENWNVHTLGTVLMSMYNGQTPSRSKGEYWNGKINWLTSGELNCGIVNDTLEKITELGLDSANLKIIPKGILVIAITGLEASGTRGNCAILGCNTTLNQSCMALFPIRSLISSDFLFNWYLFIGDYYGIKYTQGTKQQSYNSKILNDLEIVIPSLDEQNKISSFFSKLDSMIDFQKRKLNKLQATKKALLQEMFPEEGQDKPKRRFKGFTDAWEQRKLGECMNSFAYGLNAAAKEYDGMHKYIRITDIDDETHNFIQSHLTSPDIDFNMDVSDYKLNVGDIVFARTGASVGKTYLYNSNDGDLYYAGFLIRGKVKDDCDAGFIYQNTLTKDYDSFIKITSQRSGQPGVNSKEYATFRLNIPCKDEQKKISKVLNSLDELFTLHQRKLDKLKNLKQAYLNEMFV